ncbi:esterase/lipase family protein [Tsukamurella pulmonis]|uniref:esterase/lipase family protein n=1 Tax=Tsukamurella pulmonis TaxID=47312 RepID=UPI000A993166|nr:alpha/beta fold hydrolase [Tsukamurella pulmonis]
MTKKALATLLAMLSAAVLSVPGGGAAFAAPLPVRWDALSAIGPALFPETPPPGANVPCKPTAAHPNPVVLVNPTFANQATAYQAGSPYLKNAGYCVYSFNYGNPAYLPETPLQALGDVREGGRKLADKVRAVLAETGAQKVDLVGHSQGGGIMPAYYVNVLGGARYVDKFVGISPSNHGTTLSTVALLQPTLGPIGPGVMKLLGVVAPALSQQAIGSEVAKEVYAGGDTRPGVTYTTIVTVHDQVVTPYPRQYLKGQKVTNITLQEGCLKDWSEHLSTAYSRRAWNHVLNALDPANAKPVACEAVAPYFGSEPQPWAYDMSMIEQLNN